VTFIRAKACRPSTTAPRLKFLAKRTKSRRENYRRFATAAEAIGYAVEELRALRSLTASMQVGDERFNKNEIQQLYDDDDYPLRKPLSSERGAVGQNGRSNGETDKF
jgi:hypothetical protein